MEILLAIVVASAVIFFGALISIGNERQRKAIDGLREQVVLWAMQDLRTKREQLARDVKVDDPIGWLNKATTRIWGYYPNLRVSEFFPEPQALVCTSENEATRIIFSPLAPADIRRMVHGRKNRLSQSNDGNPLLALPRKPTSYEFTSLTNGFLFDLELPLVWKGLTNQEAVPMERLWMYIIQS